MIRGTVIGLCPATRPRLSVNYASQGKMAVIERSQIEADHLGDEETELVTRQTLRLTRRELVGIVSFALGAGLVFLWLLLT